MVAPTTEEGPPTVLRVPHLAVLPSMPYTDRIRAGRPHLTSRGYVTVAVTASTSVAVLAIALAVVGLKTLHAVFSGLHARPHAQSRWVAPIPSTGFPKLL